MVAQKPKSKPITVSHAPDQSPADLLDRLSCCKDLYEWPERWMGFPEDIPPGEQLVECFRPFLIHLIQLHLSRSTICKHANNLWLLGGEIIRRLDDTPSLRKTPIPKLLFDVVEDSGPLPYGWEPNAALASFESTCRKLRRFLELQLH